MAYFDEDTETITRDQVTRRISELEESGDTEYKITRDRNGEVLEDGFPSEDDAYEYLDDNDYDRDRFTVDGGLDEDDQEELENLRSFDSEASRDVPDWRFGTRLYTSALGDGQLIPGHGFKPCPHFPASISLHG